MHEDRKMFLYSGHETNIAALLQTLGVYKPHVPEYTSAVIIELYEINTRHYVKVDKILLFFLYYLPVQLISFLVLYPGIALSGYTVQTGGGKNPWVRRALPIR